MTNTCPSTYTVDRRTGEQLHCVGDASSQGHGGWGLPHIATRDGVRWFWKTAEEDTP